MSWFGYKRAKRLSAGADQYGFVGDGSDGVVVDRCAGHNNTRQLLSMPASNTTPRMGISLGQPPQRLAPGTSPLISNPLTNQVLSDLNSDAGA